MCFPIFGFSAWQSLLKYSFLSNGNAKRWWFVLQFANDLQSSSGRVSVFLLANKQKAISLIWLKRGEILWSPVLVWEGRKKGGASRKMREETGTSRVYKWNRSRKEAKGKRMWSPGPKILLFTADTFLCYVLPDGPSNFTFNFFHFPFSFYT